MSVWLLNSYAEQVTELLCALVSSLINKDDIIYFREVMRAKDKILKIIKLWRKENKTEQNYFLGKNVN